MINYIKTRSFTLYITIFSLCLASLVFQISIIRVFSSIFRYHFVFAVVSFSILGLGAGALLARWRNDDAHIVRAIVAAALLSVLPVLMIFTTPILSFLPPLAAVTIVLVPAFILSGWSLGAIFTRWPARAGKLYAADMIGAGTGCVLSVALLNLVGPVSTIIATATITSLAALIFMLGCEGRQRLGATSSVSTLLIVGFASSLIVPMNRLNVGWSPIHSINSKPMMAQMQSDPKEWSILYTKWDAYARTDAVIGPNPNLISIYTDGDTPAPMVRMHSPETETAALESHIGHIPFEAWQPKPSDRMLTIGAGGGLDVLFGQFAGVKNITAIDINPALPSILNRFRDFYGDLYNKQGTELSIQEGRHFLSRSPELYDYIYLSLTQTATATGQGIALAESYIQTLEGLRDAFNRLAPGGRLVLIFDQDAFLARAFVTALQAIQNENRNAADATTHLAVVSAPTKHIAPYNHLLILTQSPINVQERAKLKLVAEGRGFTISYLAPDTGSPLLKHLATSSEAVKTFPDTNLSPVTDDSPFFFDLSFETPLIVKILILVSAAITSVLLICALMIGPKLGEVNGRSFPVFAVLVALIGAGFIITQNVMVQRYMLFLGFPTIALSVVVFSMLAGAGLGSLISHFLIDREKGVLLLVICMMSVPGLIVLNYLGPLITEKYLYLSMTARILATGAMIFPLGISLGCFFPTALRLVGGGRRSGIPLLWAINGSAAVLGAALSMALAKQFSFTFAVNAAVGCYVGAVLLIGILTIRTKFDRSYT